MFYSHSLSYGLCLLTDPWRSSTLRIESSHCEELDKIHQHRHEENKVRFQPVTINMKKVAHAYIGMLV